MSRLGRSQPVQPQAWHGFVDPGPAPVGTVPPRITVVPLADERRRQAPPLAPLVLSGVLAPTAPPAVSPPQPLIVPLDERARRLLAPPPSFIAQARDDVLPPKPGVVEPDRQSARYRPLDPITIGALLAASAQAPTVFPPGPYVVPIETRRRLLEAVTVAHGFVDSGVGVPGTTPPPPLILDRVDQRVRYLPLPSLVSLSGTYATAVPIVVTPPASGIDQDFVPIIAGW